MADAGSSSASTKDNHKPKSEIVKQETLHKEKWLSLERITYKDPTGKLRTWEMALRTTKSQRQGVADAVAMCTILKRLLHYDCVLLVRQFRPALMRYSVEFPAGLIDSEESPGEAAIRELKEETGYIGTILNISPETALDPGISASTLNMVNMQVDGDDPVNQRPTPNPDDGEFIEVIQAPLHGLLHKLNEFSSAGDIVDARVYTYATTVHQFQRHETMANECQLKGLYRK